MPSKYAQTPISIKTKVKLLKKVINGMFNERKVKKNKILINFIILFIQKNLNKFF